MIGGTYARHVRGLGAWSARNRWPVLSAWLTALVLSLLSLPQLLSSMGAPVPEIQGGTAAQASAIIARELPQLGQEQLFLIIRSERRTVDDPTFQAAVVAAAQALGGAPGVKSVLALPKPGQTGGPFAGLAGVYRDPHNAYALVGVVGDGSTRQLNVSRQRAAAQHAVSTVDGELRVYLLGESPVNYDLRGVELLDLARAEVVAVPLALLILLLGLGALGAALAPLVLAGASVLVTLGLFGIIAPSAGFDVVLLTIVSMIGVAVGIDYALLVVSRFREERSRGEEVADAAARAVATAGRTVLYSGLVVILASGSLLAVRTQVFREFAYGTALVIAVTLVAVHTLLPALLVTGARWLPARHDRGHGWWARWARHLMRHPWRYTLAATAMVLAAAAPALDLRLGVDFGREAIAGTPSGQALAVLERDGLGGIAGAINVVLPRQPGTAPPDTEPLTRALRAEPEVAGVVEIDNGSSVHLLVVVPKTAPDSAGTLELARHVRELAGPGALIGGVGGLLLDITEETAGKLWWVIGFVLALSLLLLAVTFRSVLLPIKAILMNRLATGAALGLTRVRLPAGFHPGPPATGDLHRPFWTVYGLRGVSGQADPGGVPAHRGQHRGCRGWPAPNRATDQRRRRDHGRGVRQHAGQPGAGVAAARVRARGGGDRGRHPDPVGIGAGADAVVRSVELVAGNASNTGCYSTATNERRHNNGTGELAGFH